MQACMSDGSRWMFRVSHFSILRTYGLVSNILKMYCFVIGSYCYHEVVLSYDVVQHLITYSAVDCLYVFEL